MFKFLIFILAIAVVSTSTNGKIQLGRTFHYRTLNEYRPSYNNYEYRPNYNSYEYRPNYDSYEYRPNYDSYEYRPNYDSYEYLPTYNNYGYNANSYRGLIKSLPIVSGLLGGLPIIGQI